MIYSRLEKAKRNARGGEVRPDSGKVQEVGRKKDELLSLLGHELRAPLTAIRFALDVLRRGGGDSATREQVVGVLDRQARQMTCLIEELLDLSRFGRDLTRANHQPTDLAQIVDLAIETAWPRIEERDHRLEVALPPEPIILEGDPTALGQVLTNLLVNAAIYTEPGGEIWLTAQREENTIVLTVRDTGIGMAADALPHVFDLFWRSSQAADECKGGLGLGLALVRQLVERHGGSVSAFSPGPGQGSEFVVRLPRTGPPVEAR